MGWGLEINLKVHPSFPGKASICVRRELGRRNIRGEVLKGVGLMCGTAKS